MEYKIVAVKNGWKWKVRMSVWIHSCVFDSRWEAERDMIEFQRCFHNSDEPRDTQEQRDALKARSAEAQRRLSAKEPQLIGEGER